jgi:hypothetical protein
VRARPHGVRERQRRLTFEYAGQRDRDSLHGDPGVRVAEDMLNAMQKVESGESGWDSDLQPAIIDGWETLAKPLGEGVDTICVTLLDGKRKHTARLTKAFRQNLRRTTTTGQPQLLEGDIEGVLWECDWKQRTAQLDEADGNRVTLILPEGLDERVTELRRQRVRVRGRIERVSSRVVRITATNVAPAQGSVGEPDPRFGGFWEKLSLDELARRQGVGPVTDLDALAGDWPEGESVDDFLAMVREVRGG